MTSEEISEQLLISKKTVDRRRADVLEKLGMRNRVELTRYGERLVASHAAAIRVLLRASQVPQAALDLRVERGRPAERLADIAAREGALLIVNGSRGHGSDHSGRLGSVSSELASTAARPLVVVPPDACADRAAEARERVERARRRGITGSRRHGSRSPSGSRPTSETVASRP